MKKIILLAILILASIIYGIYVLFFDWSRHQDRLLVQSTSPNERYTVEMYLSNTHATTPFMILGVLIDNKTGKESKIYWAKGSHATVEWKDTTSVTINRQTLQVPYEQYDFRDE